jgi:hypothetical protein
MRCPLSMQAGNLAIASFRSLIQLRHCERRTSREISTTVLRHPRHSAKTLHFPKSANPCCPKPLSLHLHLLPGVDPALSAQARLSVSCMAAARGRTEIHLTG